MKLKRKHIFVGTALLLAVIICAGLVLLCLGGTPRQAVILVTPGASEQMVNDSLTKYYGRDYAASLQRTASLLGLKLHGHPGRYEIGEGTSRLQAAWRIGKGRQSPVRLTYNNLRTRADITRAVAARFCFTPAQLDSALSDASLMAGYGLTPDNADALFLNNTIEAWWTDSPRKVIERVGKVYTSFWTDGRREKASKLGLRPEDVVIIASIAEEETNHADERGRIGRLYINRLQKGMRLQADPTVRFAANDFVMRRVGRNALAIQSPYNTYRVAGLPPGPIRTVEPATIDAILDSKPSDDLYMCALPDFSGRHAFTADYSEHQRNALDYRRALDRRGIK